MNKQIRDEVKATIRDMIRELRASGVVWTYDAVKAKCPGLPDSVY